MIDTICLLIPKDQVGMASSTDQGWDLQSKTSKYEKFVKNPTKANKDTGKWFPRLTGYKRYGYIKSENVKIEISLPKLIYLNNLDELEEHNFALVLTTLEERLKEMGVLIDKAVLMNAYVCTVHFSKNIRLENGYTASHLISEMSKVNIRKTFDLARSKYINEGQSLCAHTNSHEFVIYDKVADMDKNTKKKIDRNQPTYQLNLFSEIDKSKELSEVIRFEVRLGQKRKLNQVLQKLGYNRNPRFKDIFKKDVSKKVIISYWEELIKDKNLGLFSVELTPNDILRTIYISNPNIKPKQAIYYTGLHLLSKDEGGMLRLRKIITNTSHDRTWYRLTKDQQEASNIIAKNNLRDWVIQIEDKLNKFEAYKHKKLTQ